MRRGDPFIARGTDAAVGRPDGDDLVAEGGNN